MLNRAWVEVAVLIGQPKLEAEAGFILVCFLITPMYRGRLGSESTAGPRRSRLDCMFFATHRRGERGARRENGYQSQRSKVEHVGGCGI